MLRADSKNERVRGGSHKAGRMGPRLPSVLALAGQTDTSVNTVRKALAVLVEQGLIVTVEGRGTFVIRRD